MEVRKLQLDSTEYSPGRLGDGSEGDVVGSQGWEGKVSNNYAMRSKEPRCPVRVLFDSTEDKRKYSQ